MAALAHPARRAILRRVMRREAAVTELAAPFAMSLNAVSRHIRTLERAGLVRRRRVWRRRLVSFDPAPLAEAAAWIEQTRTFWSVRLDELGRLLAAEDGGGGAAGMGGAAGAGGESDPQTPMGKVESHERQSEGDDDG